MTPNLDAQNSPQPDPAKAAHSSSFPPFQNPLFRFTFLISLGRSYHLAGDPGRILYLAGRIQDGDFEGAYQTLKQAGDEARALAEGSARNGHKVSARQAYLWAQNYYDSSTYFVDGSKDPSRFLPTWELLYDCWLKSAELSDPPIEPVRIPYENTELHGFFFHAGSDKRKRPLLILNNGSDGSLLDMWTQGGAGALARGYNCLTFDGPGQGYALWKQKLYFRPDWEKVVTPVVDYSVTRQEVDPHRIAILGISQGGYWVPRAAAFEKRLAAIIADPGVVDVATSWMSNIPGSLKSLLNAGQKVQFDTAIEQGLPPAIAATLRFRMRPYGFTSPYDTFEAVQSYRLRDVVTQIHCPVFITDPAHESFWPGQSKELYDLLSAPKQLVPFTAADGSDLHCEPNALGLRDLRVFDWLDEIMA